MKLEVGKGGGKQSEFIVTQSEAKSTEKWVARVARPYEASHASLAGRELDCGNVGWALLPVATDDGQEWPSYE
jgi:hypothetical protein